MKEDEKKATENLQISDVFKSKKSNLKFDGAADTINSLCEQFDFSNEQELFAAIHKVNNYDELSYGIIFALAKKIREIQKGESCDTQTERTLLYLKKECEEVLWELCLNINSRAVDFYKRAIVFCDVYAGVEPYAYIALFLVENEFESLDKFEQALKEIERAFTGSGDVDDALVGKIFSFLSSVNKKDGYFFKALQSSDGDLLERLKNIQKKCKRVTDSLREYLIEFKQKLSADYKKFSSELKRSEQKFEQVKEKKQSAENRLKKITQNKFFEKINVDEFAFSQRTEVNSINACVEKYNDCLVERNRLQYVNDYFFSCVHKKKKETPKQSLNPYAKNSTKLENTVAKEEFEQKDENLAAQRNDCFSPAASLKCRKDVIALEEKQHEYEKTEKKIKTHKIFSIVIAFLIIAVQIYVQIVYDLFREWSKIHFMGDLPSWVIAMFVIVGVLVLFVLCYVLRWVKLNKKMTKTVNEIERLLLPIQTELDEKQQKLNQLKKQIEESCDSILSSFLEEIMFADLQIKALQEKFNMQDLQQTIQSVDDYIKLIELVKLTK